MNILIVNVAANSGMSDIGGPGPVHGDLAFRYKPIPEYDEASKGPTYEELGLADYVPEPALKAHHDPEFDNLTYGDYLKRKPKLDCITRGDVLLFIASLDHVRTRERGFYFIGWIAVADVLPEREARKDVRCSRNAHVLRSDDCDFAVFVGKQGGLLPKAVPVTRSLAEETLLPAGGTWEMRNPRTHRVFQDIERINHLTRFPRLVSDPVRIRRLRAALLQGSGVDICEA